MLTKIIGADVYRQVSITCIKNLFMVSFSSNIIKYGRELEALFRAFFGTNKYLTPHTTLTGPLARHKQLNGRLITASRKWR